MKDRRIRLLRDELERIAQQIFTEPPHNVSKYLMAAAETIGELNELESSKAEPEINKRVRVLEEALQEIMELKDPQEIAKKALQS